MQDDPGGRIALEGRMLGNALRRARSTKRSTATKRAAVERLGQLIFHELGHVGGEQHEGGAGLMSEYTGTEVPWDVRVLARKLVPRDVKTDRRLRLKAKPRTRRFRGGEAGSEEN